MKLMQTLTLGACLLATSLAQALTLAPYSAEAFAKALAADAPVALHFHASWCPTCRAQDKVLEQLKTEPGLDILILKVDYDKETALKKQLKVRAQSTFIVYRGKTEWARATGITAPDEIRSALRTAL